MNILDIPRTTRREMMRAQLRQREKAIRAGDPHPPDVPDLRIRGNVNPKKGDAEEIRFRLKPALRGFSPVELAVRGAAARKADRAQA